MRFDLSKLLQDDLGIPESGTWHGVTAVRVKTLTLMDKSGSGIRMTLSARESDPLSSASSFLKQSFFYHSALKSFDVISADIAIHYRPQVAGQVGEVKVIKLTGYGTSNLHNISEKDRPKVEIYLKEWQVLIEDDSHGTQDDHGQEALYLLDR